DTYLLISGPGDFSQYNDDISGDNHNSRIDVTLPANGAYQIEATSYASKTTGDYTLQIVSSGVQAAAGTGAAAAPGAIAVGQTQNGELRSGDSQLHSGEFYDSYTLHGRAGQSIDVTMQSSDFDPYIMVRGHGVQEDNDDATPGDTHHSHVVVTLPQDGDYT